jgi:CheY-like chemotaxis protein
MNPLPVENQRTGCRIKTLIVDDSQAVRASLIGLVALMPGIEVAGTASNGAEALALAAADRPHLILMDLNMPVMNGLSAARLLRRRHPAMRIILLTASEGPEVRANCLASGADAFLSKDEICPKLEKTIVGLFRPPHKPGRVEPAPPQGGPAPGSRASKRGQDRKRKPK